MKINDIIKDGKNIFVCVLEIIERHSHVLYVIIDHIYLFNLV